MAAIKIEVHGVGVGTMKSLYKLGYNGSRVVVFVIAFYEPIYITFFPSPVIPPKLHRQIPPCQNIARKNAWHLSPNCVGDIHGARPSSRKKQSLSL